MPEMTPKEIVNVLPESLIQQARIRNFENEMTAIAATEVMMAQCIKTQNAQLYRTFRKAYTARLATARDISERLVGENWATELIRRSATASVEQIDLINQAINGEDWYDQICTGSPGCE